MIRRLAERVVGWQTKKHFLRVEERELYLYAYEVLFNQLINILIAILLAILFHAPLTVFLFLISYIPLRTFCGGHHAKTNEGCIVVSAILICIVCLLTEILPMKAAVIIMPMSFAISGVMIIRYAPVGDVHKPLSDLETTRYRKTSRYIWLFEAVAGMLLFFISQSAGVVLALSHIVLCIMLYGGVIKNRKIDSGILL